MVSLELDLISVWVICDLSPAAFGLRPRIDWATRDDDLPWVSMAVAGAGACVQDAVGHSVGKASGYKKPEVLGVLACGTASVRPLGVTQRGALD